MIDVVFVGAQTIPQPLVREISEGFAIDSVRLTDTATIVYAACSNHVYRPLALVSTAPPDANDAFRLIAERRFYALQKVEGIPTEAPAYQLKYGDTVRMALYFAPLPRSCTHFDLIEGATAVESAWKAYGIQLDWHLSRGSSSGLSANEGWPFQAHTDIEAYWAANRLRLGPIEGYALLSQAWTNRRGDMTYADARTDTVAIVRVFNAYRLFTLEGRPLPIRLKHHKKSRYALYYEPKGRLATVRTRSLTQWAGGAKLRIRPKAIAHLPLAQKLPLHTKVYWSVAWEAL